MAAQTAIDIALSLARDRRSQAEQLLAAAQARARQASEQCTLLTRYRDDYQRRLHGNTQGAGAMDVRMLMNNRAFVARLDLAVEAQRQESTRLETELVEAQRQWTEACRHEKSIEILLARRAAAATLRANRAEQKLSDEFAARAVRRTQAV
jgi:flagellar FliJ protein